MTRRPRTVVRVRRAGLAALAAGVAYVLLGVPFFVLPAVDPLPRHADVVLVLGPPMHQRVAVADDLLRRGVVDHALVSVPYDRVPPELAAECGDARVTCFDPDPRTTRGEARELRRETAARGWTSAVVVTTPAHVSRSRTIVSRCFAGTITMRESDEAPFRGWAYQYLYQTAATVKAWFLQGC